MTQKNETIVKFFKEIFGDDFKFNGLSVEEGKIEYIDNSTDVSMFFLGLDTTTIWYNPFEGILYSYKPQEDSMFKKVFTNAWGFKYIFYPLFIKDWGGWWSDYHFQVYEKGLYGNYKTIKMVYHIRGVG